MNVLITDAELPSSLAMIRSLGKKDIKVIAISNSSKAIGFYSRYCYKAIKHLPTGYSIKNDSIILKHIEKEIKFIKSIKLIIDKFNIDLLIPNSENTLIPISKNRKEINALVPLPLHRTVMKVHDKGLMTRFCKKNNIPVPRTYFPKSESDIKNIIKGENFPLIIRSTVSEGSNNVYLCRNKEEIFNSYKQLINLKRKIMIQEYIFGDYYGFIGVLNKKSKLSSSFTYKIMEDDEKNYVISKQNKKIKELSQKIATKLSWIGIFNPQFRINEKGKPILIEVNPRAPTSLLLAIACGIDIPYILNEIMIGKNIKNNSLQKEKILLFSSKSFIQNIEKIGLVNFFKKIIHKNIIIDMVFSFGDPLPSIFFYYYLLKKLFWTSSPTIRNWF